MSQTILRIDASARGAGSVTRDLSERIVNRWPDATVIHRDLAQTPVPQLDESWVDAVLARQSWGVPAATLERIGDDVGSSSLPTGDLDQRATL